MRTAVFVGPSIERTALSGLDCTFYPPIKRGDLPRVLADGAERIVIIDGEFGQSLAVSVREIRTALRTGVPVWGSSSMGALRAAECRPLGMRGVGWVFEGYAAGRFVADDEVALVFSPFDWTPLTVPLVNVRWAVAQAVVGRIIDERTGRELVEHSAAISFEERTWARLAAGIGAERTEAFFQWAASQGREIDIKRKDALQLVATVWPRGL